MVTKATMYNWNPASRRPRGRLRKRKKGTTSSFYQKAPSKYSLRVTHHSSSNKKYGKEEPMWGGLHKAWLAYVIAKSQNDYEKMRKYAIVIQKFERRLNIEINDFPELKLYAFDAFDNKEEVDDSKLTVIDPWTNEKIRDAKEDEDDN